MNYNTKLFDLLDTPILEHIRRHTEVRNTRLKDLTVDELRELWPFIANKFPSHFEPDNVTLPEPVKSLITLIKML